MRHFLGFICLTMMTASCTINSDLMFRTPTDYEFDKIVDATTKDYTLGPNDIINFRLYTNNGVQLIELNRNQANATRNLSFSLDYVIGADSIVRLPSIGPINITGLTVPQAQDSLSIVYAEKYNNPFIQIEVTNNRVIVFPGSGGQARVVQLANNNTSVIEVLAISGGISSRGKASMVKLIRKEDEEVKVYLMDLSTIEGIDDANTVVQTNDIIYVEPTAQIASEILSDIRPVILVLSTTLQSYFLFRSLQN